MENSEFILRYCPRNRPKRLKCGQIAYLVPQSIALKYHEVVLTLSFMTKRQLFGLAYRALQPEYFRSKVTNIGLYICPTIPTSELSLGVQQPGDIDLLIIPYEGDELLLHKCMAIEIKVVRASFKKQGKSPNEYGFTQARGLLDLGFPYVAVAHLIVSDQSPEEAWKEAGVARIIDPRTQEVELLPHRLIDWMPDDLTQRVFGRLLKCGVILPQVGLVAAYVGASLKEVCHQEEYGVWYPRGRIAGLNRNVSRILLSNIASFFDRNASRFLDNPKSQADST